MTNSSLHSLEIYQVAVSAQSFLPSLLAVTSDFITVIISQSTVSSPEPPQLPYITATSVLYSVWYICIPSNILYGLWGERTDLVPRRHFPRWTKYRRITSGKEGCRSTAPNYHLTVCIVSMYRNRTTGMYRKHQQWSQRSTTKEAVFPSLALNRSILSIESPGLFLAQAWRPVPRLHIPAVNMWRPLHIKQEPLLRKPLVQTAYSDLDSSVHTFRLSPCCVMHCEDVHAPPCVGHHLAPLYHRTHSCYCMT